MRRSRDHLRRAFDADDMRGQLCADPAGRGIDHRQGEALSNRMAITAGGDETDALAVPPDRLIAAGVSVDGLDIERDNPPPCAGSTFAQRRLATDEIVFVEGYPLIQPGRAGRVVLGEFTRPDAEALFEAQRADRV